MERKFQMKINGCHCCVNRSGCKEKKNPCDIHRKEPKKKEKDMMSVPPVQQQVM